MRLIVLFFIILVSAGCVEKFDVNYQTESMPGIAGIFSQNDDSIKVLVYWGLTPDKADDEFSPISNASVALYDKEQVLSGLNGSPHNQYYSCANVTTIGGQYKIVVSIPEYGTISAKTYIPEPVDIQFVRYDTLSMPDEYGFLHYYADFSLKLRNLYSDTLYLAVGFKGLGVGDIIIDDPVIGKWDTRSRNEIVVFAIKNIQDSVYSFTIRGALYDTWIPPDREISDTVSVRFYVMTLSEEAYRTFLSYNFSLGQSGLWDIPLDYFTEPVSAYSNVENGYGYFAGYSVDSTRIISFYAQTSKGKFR